MPIVMQATKALVALYYVDLSKAIFTYICHPILPPIFPQNKKEMRLLFRGFETTDMKAIRSWRNFCEKWKQQFYYNSRPQETVHETIVSHQNISPFF